MEVWSHSFFIVFCPFSSTFSLYSKVSLSILPSTAINIRFSTLWSCFCWPVIFTLVFALSTLHLSIIISFILIFGIRIPIAFKYKSKKLARLAPRIEDMSPLTNSRVYLGNLVRLKGHFWLLFRCKYSSGSSLGEDE